MKKYNLINIPTFSDDRGILSVLEEETVIPFKPKRLFYIQKVPRNEERGNHANIYTQFLMVAIQGSVLIHVEDKNNKKDFLLNNPSKGLFLDSMTWKSMKNFSKDAILLVIANTNYSESDYITNYKEFKEKA